MLPAPDCIHYRDIGRQGWGQCAAGLHGGRPSHGTCAACEFRCASGADCKAIPAPAHLALPVTSSEIARRREICKRCAKNKGLTQFTVACDCATCRAKPIATWKCPLNQWDDTNRSSFFDAVWCINLDVSRDRWEEFQTQLAGCDWPFREVTRFAAIHGDTVGVPAHYHQGGGAWGCLQSHRRVLELSLMAGYERVLVMEDDVDLRPEFGQSARSFISALGDEPWDCLMLGGQHHSPPTAVRPGIVRAAPPRGIQRTHCLAYTRAFMRELYRHWSGPIDQHCDWSLGPFAARHRTLAPERFFAGRRGGISMITRRPKPPEWWNAPAANAQVVWLRCRREVLEATRDIFHAGYRRDDRGVCLGLAEVFDSSRHPTPQRKAQALRRWITMIQWEVQSRSDGSVCTIWCPEVDAEAIRSAVGKELVEIEVQSEEEARKQYQGCNAAGKV